MTDMADGIKSSENVSSNGI